MCGRFVDPNLRSAGFDTSWLKINPLPQRFNIKPSEAVLIWAIEPQWARWGLIPSWHKGALKDWKASTINARIEEAKDKASFRGAWRYGRCLIPAGGYYEWSGARSPKQPHFFHSPGNEGILWFAGLISPWQDLLTCTILTRAANDSVSPLHDRMPVILNLEERAAWLGGSEDLQIGAEAQLLHHPVKPFGLGEDGPDLIEPFAPIAPTLL